jgi:tetratricopeptide (TPR) repeat protein
MKNKISLLLGLAFILSLGEWIGVEGGAIASTQPRMNIHSSFLLAKIICPPEKPCYDDGRGSLSEINIISPRRGALLSNNNRPNISWFAVPNATSYSIRIENSKGVFWDTTSKDPKISYPDDKPPLEPDKDYTLIVETIVNTDKLTGRANFRLLDLAHTQRIQTEAGKIIAKTQLTSDDKALELAKLDSKPENDLLTEAIEILNHAIKDGSHNVSIYQMLGDLYLQVKLPTLAETTYQQALDIATSLKNINAQAEAQIGLGEVNANLQNWQQAITFLNNARGSYQDLKDLESASQVAQFIGEMYENLHDNEQAIAWYKQAKSEYEMLGDIKQANYVEGRIKNLI